MYFWLWIAIFFIAFVIEILTAANLVSIWFSFGAVFALIANYLKLSFTVQIIFFLIGTVLFFILFRPILKKFIVNKSQATNYDRYIGNRYRLKTAIKFDRKGTIQINDIVYNTISNTGEELEENQLVEIVAFEGSKVIVRKVGK